MNRSKASIACCLVLFWCGQAAAQVKVSTEVVQTLQGVSGVTPLGGSVVVSGDPDEITFAPAGKIVVETEAANVEVDVEDRERRRIDYERFDEGDGRTVFLIFEPGKVWIDVTAIDFAKNIYRRETGLTLTIPPGSPIGPGPGPAIEPPSAELQPKVSPLGKKLAEFPEKAAALAAMFDGFGMGASIICPSTTERLWLVHGSAFKLLDVPAGVSIGSDVDRLVEEHVGIERKDGKIVDRSLDGSDQVKIAEIYRAIAWGVLQK